MNCKLTFSELRVNLQRAPVLLLLLISFASCTPSKHAIRTTPANKQIVSKTDGISIITDSYISLDPLFSKDYVLLDASRKSEAYILDETRKQLELKGYRVKQSIAPVVGSFALKNYPYQVANVRKGAKNTKTPPFYIDEQFKDEEYVTSMIQLNAHVANAIINKKTTVQDVGKQINESLAIIADRLNDDKVLVIIGNGELVPIGKTLTQAFTIGLITAVLTMGMVTYYAYDASYFVTLMALVDLNSGELIWTNKINLLYNPTKPQFYEKQWGKNLFYHFPEKQ